ncbi:hypothetical protein [Aeromonas sp. ARM81]|uniref:hypothetical protein n=1 Tax=Aeromonas sp. ARM81 TaxID=1747384 RepID=UPI0011C07BED|nr:hypothetical protein [Aeromonas sp. ARM81]
MTYTAEQIITSSLGTKSHLINNQRIKALLDEWRDALVSGSVFTDYRWQEWDHVDQFDPDRSVSATRNYFKKNGYHLRTLGEFTQEDLALVDMDPAIVLSSADMDARRQRSDLLVGERWRSLKDSRRSGHHPLQWQAKRQLSRLGKTTGNFTEIAGDPDAIAYRQTLVSIWFCARLLFISNRGSVVTPNTYPIYPYPNTPEQSSVSLTIEEIQMLHRKISFALALEAGQAGAEGEGAGQKRSEASIEASETKEMGEARLLVSADLEECRHVPLLPHLYDVHLQLLRGDAQQVQGPGLQQRQQGVDQAGVGHAPRHNARRGFQLRSRA